MDYFAEDGPEAMGKNMPTDEEQMQQMQTNNGTNNPPTFHRQYRRTQNSQATTSNPNQCKYCWTHGWCNHYGRDCRSKADGHQDAATCNNRMGGSTRNIPDVA